MTDDKPKQSSAWLWPAEWSVERSFWREVATRTVAGILTLIILGVPTLIASGFAGAIGSRQVLAIIAGVTLFIALLATYIVILVFIRRAERKKIEQAVVDEFLARGSVSTDDVKALSQKEFAAILKTLSAARRKAVRDARRTARTQAILAAVGIVLGVATALISFYVH